MKKPVILITARIFFISVSCFSQPGSLDPNFGTDGIVITDVGDLDFCESVLIQPDRKIVIAGTSDENIAVIRYNTDGTLDNTFGDNGIVITEEPCCYGSAMVQQSDGKILVAGHIYIYTGPDSNFDVYLVRYNTNGTLDTTFSVDGKVITDPGGDNYIHSMALQSDGKIVLTGQSDNYIVVLRYNTDGSLDHNFGINGIVNTSVGGLEDNGNSVVIQPDSKIVVAGSSYNNSTHDDIVVLRYNSNGTPDTGFGDEGIVITDIEDNNDIALAIVLQPDGKILAAGYTENVSTDFIVLRYNSDGSLDNTFSVDGKSITDLGSLDRARSLAIQPDGKILATGFTRNGDNDDLALVRYNPDGTLDLTFDEDGKVVTDFNNSPNYGNALKLQANGKIVVAGHIYSPYNFMVARYLSGLNLGIVNFSDQSISPLIYPNPIQNETTLKYELKKEENISIELYDMKGERVQTFFSHERKSSGIHEEKINIAQTIPPGTYLLVISNNVGRQSILISKD